jgi:hypothetical protein
VEAAQAVEVSTQSSNHEYNNRVDALCNKLMDEHKKGKTYD